MEIQAARSYGELMARLKELFRKVRKWHTNPDRFDNADAENCYERIGIANELTRNREWLKTSFNDDLDKAVQALERDCFADICFMDFSPKLHRNTSLEEMIAIYTEFREETKEWTAWDWRSASLSDQRYRRWLREPDQRPKKTPLGKMVRGLERKGG